MNAKGKINSCRKSSATDKTLRRLITVPENALKIFEFAESLYMRDEQAERMSFADIEQVNEFLRQTENNLKQMKKQFQDLAAIEDGFQTDKIPIGF